MKKKELEQMGLERWDRDTVYLTGSQKTIKRTIYANAQGTYCEWYGQMIEVVENERFGGYHTKLDY